MPEIALTEQNFEQEVLKSETPVLVDFWAPWCGPCQMMGPIVEELASSYDASKAKVAKLNVDENPGIAGTYQVLSIPTFIVFKNGAVADKLIGGVPKEKLKEFFERHLS